MGRLRRNEPLAVGPLDAAAVELLHPRIRKIDRQECYIMGGSNPRLALEYAQDARVGPAYAVWGKTPQGVMPVGAYGATTQDGSRIWSLWTDDLDRSMAGCILRHTPRIVADLMLRSPTGVLDNYVKSDNDQAKRWLKLSGCFNIAERATILGDTRAKMLHFQTKTLREVLARV
jgi:hypothetical protein